MNERLGKLIARHDWIAGKVRAFTAGSVAPALRMQAIRILMKGRQRLLQATEDFAAKNLEQEANAAFTMATMLQSTQGLLTMWDAFTAGKFSDAWKALIEGQDAARAALSYSSGAGGCEIQLGKMIELERLLFPHQAFFSPSLVILEERCSICDEILDGCPHMPGRLYCGKPCRGKVIRFYVDSVGLVDNPADKQCYARQFPAHNGFMRDCFTRKLLRDAEKKKSETALLLVSSYMRDFVITDEVVASLSPSLPS